MTKPISPLVPVQIVPAQSRRSFIKQLGFALATAPLAGIVACGGGSTQTPASSTDTTGGSTGGSTGSSGSGSGTWATGGTAALSANFPADSLFDLGTSCSLALTKALTEGPCYFAVPHRDDISESQVGLPMQLCLRVVDSNCQPLSGLEVEVWHCDVAGLYSGDTSGSSDSGGFNAGFCTGNNSNAQKAKWYRGTQVTDSNGRVNFKSCFPGWYSSRTIHIHFRVRNNNNDQVVSQFCFTDALTQDICTTHANYSGRGIQDTPLASGRDTVFGSSATDFIFSTQQNSDGSLLAWKTIRLS